MPVFSFDVAVVPATLSPSGRRDLSARRWVRVVIAEDRLVAAHLLAAQMVGVHRTVTDVLLRE